MLFSDEEDMQEAAVRLARQLDTIPVPPRQRAAFIRETITPDQWKPAIYQTISDFDPRHHYTILSYTRLALTGR